MTLTYVPPSSVSIWSDVSAQTGAKMLCAVADCLPGSEFNLTTGGSQASSRGHATIIVPADSKALTFATITKVVRIDETWADGTVRTYEFRITQIDDSQADDASAAIVTLTCATIIEDYGRTKIRSVIGGVPVVAYQGLLKSPAAYLADALAALTAQGFTGGSIGTVTPVGLFTFPVQNDVTPFALMTWLEGETQAECWRQRTSETTWTLNLGIQGAGGTQPIATVGDNVISLKRTVIIDDTFTNRVEPEGLVASTESAPTHMGGSTWDVNGVSSRVVTIADPDMPGDVILEDTQLDGTEALTPLDPLHWATPGGIGTAFQVIDTTRHILWGYSGSGDGFWWRDTDDDTNQGTLALGNGMTSCAGIIYDSGVDRIIIAPGDVSTLVYVNASTKAVANTQAMTNQPTCLQGIAALSLALVGSTAGGTANTPVNTSTRTAATNLTNVVDSTFQLAYIPGLTRFVVMGATTGNASIYNSSTNAFVATVSTGISLVSIATEETTSPMLVVNRSGSRQYGTLDVNAHTFSGFSSFPALTPSDAWSAQALIKASGLYYVLTQGGGPSQQFVAPFTGSAWTFPYGDVAGCQLTRNAIALEPAPTTAETSAIYLLDATTKTIRRLALRPSPVEVSPFEHWAVSSTLAGAQTVTMPASGSGGPRRLIPDSRIQFRQSSALDYLTRLTSPSSINTPYPVVDKSPAVSVTAKWNFWRGGRLDEWRSDDTNRWLTSPNFGLAMAQRWRAANAVASAGLAITINANYTAGDSTIHLSGLAPGQQLNPGDCIVFGSATNFGTSNLLVRQFGTADGSGNLIASIVGNVGTSKTSGASCWLWQPLLTPLPGSRTDCLALYGSTSPFSMLVPVVPLPSDSVCWVVAHVKIACYGITPSDVSLVVGNPFTSANNAAVVPAQTGDTSPIATGVVIDRWLSERVDLSAIPGPGLARVNLTPNGSAGSTLGVVYPQSIAVVLAADTTFTNLIDTFDSESPRALWRAAQLTLEEGRSPTAQYDLAVKENNPGTPFSVGVSPLVIDPTRGIVSSPRIISETRAINGPDLPIKLPVLQCSTVPTSFIREFTDLQAIAANLQGASL